MKIVYTKEELERALKAKEYEIIIKGELATKINNKIKAKKRVKAGAIGIGIASILAAPFTGGTSLVGLGATAVALTGGEIITIIIILCGWSLAMAAILKGYDVIEFDKGFVKLRRKA